MKGTDSEPDTRCLTTSLTAQPMVMLMKYEKNAKKVLEQQINKYLYSVSK